MLPTPQASHLHRLLYFQHLYQSGTFITSDEPTEHIIITPDPYFVLG